MPTIISCLIIISLIIVLFVSEVVNKVYIKDKGLAPLMKNSVGIQFYFDIENESKSRECEVLSEFDKCCLTGSEEDEDECESVHVYGKTVKKFKPKQRSVLTFVYPTICFHDLVGYCDVFMQIDCGKPKKNQKYIRIPFDTRLIQKRKPKHLFEDYVKFERISSCESLDEDSMDHCKPVNCDWKYSDQKSFFDNITRRCVKAPHCVSKDTISQLPNIVFDPITNCCKDLDLSLQEDDIYLLTTGLGISKVKTRPIRNREPEMDLDVSNCTISQKIAVLEDLLSGKNGYASSQCQHQKSPQMKHCMPVLYSIFGMIFLITGILVAIVFGLQLLVWLIRNRTSILNGINRFFSKKFRKKRGYYDDEDLYRPLGGGNMSQVKSSLIKAIVTRDIPMELRDSALSMCCNLRTEVEVQRSQEQELAAKLTPVQPNVGHQKIDSDSSASSI